jgi:hypothetical protein
VAKAASAIPGANNGPKIRISQRHNAITNRKRPFAVAVDASLASAYFQGYFVTWQKNKPRKGIVAKKYFNLWL